MLLHLPLSTWLTHGHNCTSQPFGTSPHQRRLHQPDSAPHQQTWKTPAFPKKNHAASASQHSCAKTNTGAPVSKHTPILPDAGAHRLNVNYRTKESASAQTARITTGPSTFASVLGCAGRVRQSTNAMVMLIRDNISLRRKCAMVKMGCVGIL